MNRFEKYFNVALEFHGHKCPAMPMGLKAGLAAMRALGVERSKDKELFVEAETGKGHAAGCFLDGIMTATGCTYGKSNIQKLYYSKMAFTLADTKTGRAVRVSLKPEFFEKALNSPFVGERKKGVPPQDIPPEITGPLVKKILSLPEGEFLDISDVFKREVKKGSPNFNVRRCAECGEAVFTDKLIIATDGRKLCIPCTEEEKGAEKKHEAR
ncbi:MAG: FmdE family protein [Nitrospiraceae bacterium]|nr:FmdE family protein [Nitrospiraceae bacterium]